MPPEHEVASSNLAGRVIETPANRWFLVGSSDRVKSNTVNLSGQNSDAVFGLRGGLGPVSVLGALHAPARHLALDDPWVPAEAALGEGFSPDLRDRLLICGVDPEGGKDPVGCVLSGGRRAGRG